MNEINVGVIGCGHWGPNHIRNSSGTKGCRVKWACDLDPKRLEAIKELFPSIQTTGNMMDVINDADVTAVIISTPTSTHYEIAKLCLENNKDVLCEKPLTIEVNQSEELVRIADQRKRILMVGHVFLFNAGIKRLKEYVRTGEVGNVYYIHATRTNLGPIRQDVNVVFDLASHDVSILNYLLESQPTEVSAKGECFLKPGIEDVAFITLMYPNKVLANIHVSWLDPKKIRQLTVVGTKKMITWDDMINSEPPLRIYNKGVEKGFREQFYKDFAEFHMMLREEEIMIPPVKLSEPLKEQSNHFYDCIRKGFKTVSDAEFGLGVVKVLNAVNKSIRDGGKPVSITHS